MSFLKLQLIGSSDVDVDEWQPRNPEDIYFPLDIYVGPRGEDGNNRFDVMVVSKAALKKYEPSTTDPKRGYFIIDEFDWGAVRRYVEDCVTKSDTGEWDSSIQNLRKFFFWEYDNFQRA